MATSSIQKTEWLILWSDYRTHRFDLFLVASPKPSPPQAETPSARTNSTSAASTRRPVLMLTPPDGKERITALAPIAKMWAMAPSKASMLLLPLVLMAVLGGCGSGGSPAGSPAAGGKRFYHAYPGQQATDLHISGSDCRALAGALERQTGASVRRSSDPTPSNSHCQLQGRGVHVSISLDTAYRARERYSYRMQEQVQFNAAYPDRVPRAVPHVGDPGAHNHNASWIPAYSTLYAVRGNRWLTLAYSVAGETRPQRLAGAADLARLAFRLTAR